MDFSVKGRPIEAGWISLPSDGCTRFYSDSHNSVPNEGLITFVFTDLHKGIRTLKYYGESENFFKTTIDSPVIG